MTGRTDVRLIGARILLASEEMGTENVVAQYLTGAGYQVTAPLRLSDGPQATGETPHVVVLDFQQADLTSVMRTRVWRHAVRAPLVVLVPPNILTGPVSYLNAGADACLLKPVHQAELLARIQVQLRVQMQADRLKVGKLTFLISEEQCQCAGRLLPLTGTEFRVLLTLARQAGTVCTRDELIEQVWGGRLDLESNAVDVYVSKIRAKLREVNAGRVIRTIRGRGYMIPLP